MLWPGMTHESITILLLVIQLCDAIVQLFTIEASKVQGQADEYYLHTYFLLSCFMKSCCSPNNRGLLGV